MAIHSGKKTLQEQLQGGNEGQKIYLSEINSKILEAAVDAYNGGIEVISTEDMNVTLGGS